MDIGFLVIKTPKQSFMDAWVQRVKPIKVLNIRRIVKSFLLFFFLHAPISFFITLILCPSISKDESLCL
jgi:hypothetical protein